LKGGDEMRPPEPGGWIVFYGKPIYTGTGAYTADEAEALAEYWELSIRWEDERRAKSD
jgi:hypothetical protein